MEDQNLNLAVALSLSSTQNGSETTNNLDVAEVVGVDVGSDTGAKSEAGGSETAPVKKVRGRPRKNEGVEKQVSLAMPVTAPGVSIQADGDDGKRGRGRPRGSGKFQILASIGGDVAETAGGTLTPHVLIVNPGEDVIAKILTFWQNGPRAALCILSATGTVSSAVIRHPGSTGFVRYEGRFEIISLCGTYTYSNGAAAGSSHRRIGMLTVSLATPDGKVFGGGIENSLIAANPIQLVLASFKQNISNQIKRKYSTQTSTSPNMVTPEQARENSLKIPKLTLGESSTRATTNTNDVTVAETNVVAETTPTGVTVTDNVTTVAAEHVERDYVGAAGGVGFDNQTLETGVDVNSVPQI